MVPTLSCVHICTYRNTALHLKMLKHIGMSVCRTEADGNANKVRPMQKKKKKNVCVCGGEALITSPLCLAK